MTDEEIEKGLNICFQKGVCLDCDYFDCRDCADRLRKDIIFCISRLKSEKQLAETQLKELLSALYQRADNKDKSFTIYQNDIVELAKDYGIKEEDLNEN